MKRYIAALSAVGIAVIIVVPSLFLLDLSTPSFTVKEGARNYTVIGNLFGNKSIIDGFDHLNASTSITESGHRTDDINAVMSGSTFSLNQNNTFDFQLFLVVQGSLPGDLHPNGLRISVSPLSDMSWEFSDYVNNCTTQNKGLAITPTPSFPPSAYNVSSSQGNSVVNFAFKNDTGLKANQTFNFYLMDLIDCGALSIPAQWALQYNTSYGVSVTLSLLGLNKPVFIVFSIYFVSIH